MELTNLANDAMAILVPALPYLLEKAGDKAVDLGIEKIGKAAWEQAKNLWSKIWPKAKEKEAAREAVNILAKEPDNRDAQAMLRLQLKLFIDADHQLAQEIGQIVNETMISKVITATGAGSVAAEHINQSIIVTGKENVVNRGP